MSTLNEKAKLAFITARDKAIAKNGHSKFAEAEQMEVIEAMVDFMQNDEEAQVEGFDSIRPFIQAVANASAYAQLLDKHGKIKRAQRGSGGSKANFI